MRLFIWLALVALAAALVVGCNKNGQPAGAAGKGSPTTTVSSSSNTPDTVRRVTINDLRDDLERGKAIVVDVRGDAAYTQEHIKGALDIPEAQIVSRMGELPKDKLVVLYCS